LNLFQFQDYFQNNPVIGFVVERSGKGWEKVHDKEH
jgi:hypothetical protein